MISTDTFIDWINFIVICTVILVAAAFSIFAVLLAIGMIVSSFGPLVVLWIPALMIIIFFIVRRVDD